MMGRLLLASIRLNILRKRRNCFFSRRSRALSKEAKLKSMPVMGLRSSYSMRSAFVHLTPHFSRFSDASPYTTTSSIALNFLITGMESSTHFCGMVSVIYPALLTTSVSKRSGIMASPSKLVVSVRCPSMRIVTPFQGRRNSASKTRMCLCALSGPTERSNRGKRTKYSLFISIRML